LTPHGRDNPAVVVEVRRATAAGVNAVWAVLADGRQLAAWVVGAGRTVAPRGGSAHMLSGV
jgi:uncharacterized protein YndB with AHSA1/START domain